MCGRYYWDQKTAQEIEKVISQTGKSFRREASLPAGKTTSGDVRPTETAPVLAGKGGCVCCAWQRWGFPGFQKRQVIFNARCESVTEKPLFCDSIRYSRTAVPAAWFYEWNREKEKNTFYRKDDPVLFMAGCSREYEDGVHFVILTVAANASMRPVHDRMPLILEREEIAPWILDHKRAMEILHKTPCLLERKTDYEQLTLF